MIISKTTMIALSVLALPCAGFAGFTSILIEPDPVLVDASAISIEPANGLRMHEGKPFTGLSQKLRSDGSIAEMDSFAEGLRDGPSTMWFADGQKAYETHFKDGLRDGISRTWWSNGHLRSQTEFVADKQEGAAWAWYSTGQNYKRHFYKNGVPFGIQRAWRKNGKLYENFEIRNGRSYGLRNANMCVEVKGPEA